MSEITTTVLPFIFHTERGIALQSVAYRPPEPIGQIIVMHGLGEHAGRYAHTANVLASRGYVVSLFDARGHGQTGVLRGDLGQLEGLADVVTDLGQFVRFIADSQPDLGKPFLLGHSMGGLLALRLAIDEQAALRGLIVSSPWLDLPFRLPSVIKRLIHLMASASPRLGAVGVDPRTVSRDPDVVAAYTADPLIWHHRVPFQVLASGLTMMDDVIARAGQIALPTLWLYGTADALVYPLGSPPTFASLGSTDKTLIAEEGGYHELLNEPDKEKIEATILDWMNRH